MKRHDAAIARHAARHSGLATIDQLHGLGLSDQELKDLRRAGILLPVHRGVVRHAAVPLTDHNRLLAAVLAAGPTAVASHRSAGAQLGFEIRRHRPEITVPGTALPRLSGVTVHRTKVLDPIDVTVAGGIPCTARGRTALELGAVLPWELYEHVLQVAVIEKRVDPIDMVATLDRIGGRGKGGSAPLRAFLRDSVPDHRLASLLEHLVLGVVVSCGAPMPELQYELVCVDGRRVVFDIAWPRWRLAFDAQGHRWHATRKQLDHDEARRRSIRASDWDHDGFTWSDVHEHRARTELEILRTLSRYGS